MISIRKNILRLGARSSSSRLRLVSPSVSIRNRNYRGAAAAAAASKSSSSSSIVKNTISNNSSVSEQLGMLLFGQQRASDILLSYGGSNQSKEDKSINMENNVRVPPIAIRSIKPTINNRTSDGVTVEWEDGDSSFFHLSWLFRTCACAQCKQAHSGQLLRLPQDFPLNPTAKNISLSADQQSFVVEWDASHSSTFSSSWLMTHRYDNKKFAEQRVRSIPKPLLRDTPVPRISYDDVMNSENAVCDWVNMLAEHGCCIVYDTPTKPKTVLSLSQRIGPTMHTIYGLNWQVKADDVPINIAYSNVALGLHTDLAYYESPPALQFLHCLRFDDKVEGGESLLLDLFAAAEQLRSVNPTAFQTLCELPATFQKIHYERADPVYLVSRRPHIWTSPLTGDVIGGLWAPPFEGPPLLPPSQIERYFEAYHEFAKIIEDPESPLRLTFKLVPGETLCFSNRRMLHGRNAFVQKPGAIRHLEGCYISAEDFISTLQRSNLKIHGKTNDVALMLSSHLP